MFEVGFTEIILILGIALVVLGPEKLPKVAADIGRWVGRARAMARQFRAQLDEEVIKADRDWAKPAQPHRPAPKSRPAAQDVDVSPNRQAPPPGNPPDAAPAGGATADGEEAPPATDAADTAPSREADSP